MFKHSALIASCLFEVPHGNICKFILEKKSIEPINSEPKWLLIENADADWYLTGLPVSVSVHWGLTLPVVSKKNTEQESKEGAPKDGEEKDNQGEIVILCNKLMPTASLSSYSLHFANISTPAFLGRGISCQNRDVCH